MPLTNETSTRCYPPPQFALNSVFNDDQMLGTQYAMLGAFLSLVAVVLVSIFLYCAPKGFFNYTRKYICLFFPFALALWSLSFIGMATQGGAEAAKWFCHLTFTGNSTVNTTFLHTNVTVTLFAGDLNASQITLSMFIVIFSLIYIIWISLYQEPKPKALTTWLAAVSAWFASCFTPSEKADYVTSKNVDEYGGNPRSVSSRSTRIVPINYGVGS